MSAIAWTTEAPTAPGWYWWRYDAGDSKPEIVALQEKLVRGGETPGGVMEYLDEGGSHEGSYWLASEKGGEWWPQPIPVPLTNSLDEDSGNGIRDAMKRAHALLKALSTAANAIVVRSGQFSEYRMEAGQEWVDELDATISDLEQAATIRTNR